MKSLSIFAKVFAVTAAITMCATSVFGYANPYYTSVNQYHKTAFVGEGELCGDVSQQARRGGIYYECEGGLACEHFELGASVGHHEPFGICVRTDMDPTCPMVDGECAASAIHVSHEVMRDDQNDMIRLLISAQNTTDKALNWSEYRSECAGDKGDVFGVKGYTMKNGEKNYMIGQENEFYEFMDHSKEFQAREMMFNCIEKRKFSYEFDPYEKKVGILSIPVRLLLHTDYEFETKYGGEYEILSGGTTPFTFNCTEDEVVSGGYCVSQDAYTCENSGGNFSLGECMCEEGFINVHGACARTEDAKDFLFETYNIEDVRGHFSEAYVLNLAEHGYVEGYRNGLFRPDQPITRAELTKLLILALEIDQINHPSKPYAFRDVSYKTWFYDYVYTAMKKGIVQGYDDDTFRPNRSVSRAEAMSLAMKAIHIPSYDYSSSHFEDVVEMWQVPYIDSAYRLGLVDGMEDGLFHPDKVMTRGEAAKVISNLMELKEVHEDIIIAELEVPQLGLTTASVVEHTYMSLR